MFQRTIYEWRVVFWIMFISLIIASSIFTLFGSGELQPWDNGEINDSSTNKEQENKKNYDYQQFARKVPVITKSISP